MAVVEVEQITKSFGPVKAVDGVSYSVEKGEIFGLLGPNGAGKTTSIRILLDIFKPDSGRVAVLGGPMTEAKKDCIGYLPEERGLYQDIPLDRCLLYLASLKGMSSADARQKLEPYLERFGLAEHRHKKVKELSKGMQQKAQIIATLLHQPELVIIDEPFSGLDPVNSQLVKNLLLDLHRQGTTILMSTHQMHQVEELCERIVLINHGQAVLYGDLASIRRRFAGHAVLVRAMGGAPAETLYRQIPGVEAVEPHNGAVRLNLAPSVSTQDILRLLLERSVPLEQFEIASPTLDEIFIQVVGPSLDRPAPLSEN